MPNSDRTGGSASADETRTRLISAAERLFAQRGIDSVSLREVNRESGARNAIAIQYHFKDRAGILDAVLAKHSAQIEAARHTLLDSYEAAGGPDVRAMAGALVRPLAAKLSDPDGGPDFLQIHAQVLDRPSGRSPLPVAEGVAGPVAGGSLTRWREMIDPLLERDAVRLHRRYTAILHTATELGRRARSGPHTDDRLFTSYLVDMVAAILTFPVTAETRRLADDRDRARRPERGRRRRAVAG